MWMKVKIEESFSLDWIESLKFGQEFEELKPSWSTKSLSLWDIKLIVEALNLI